jgi:hypothetical protein
MCRLFDLLYNWDNLDFGPWHLLQLLVHVLLKRVRHLAHIVSWTVERPTVVPDQPKVNHDLLKFREKGGKADVLGCVLGKRGNISDTVRGA